MVKEFNNCSLVLFLQKGKTIIKCIMCIYSYINKISYVWLHSYTGHRCSKAGCGSVLVIDGNLKNHRSVCAASEAGYVQYDGLPGKIKTGCTNTPCQKSRFCLVHKPRTLTTDNESL